MNFINYKDIYVVVTVIILWELLPKILLHKPVTPLGIFSFQKQCIFSTPRMDIINKLYVCENWELNSAFTSFQVFKLGFISGKLITITHWCFIFLIHIYFMSFDLLQYGGFTFQCFVFCKFLHSFFPKTSF